MKDEVLFRQTKSGRYLIKAAAMAFVILFVCIAFTGCYYNKTKKFTEIEKYNSYLSDVPYADDMMPDCEQDIGTYKSVQFGYKYRLFIFESEGITLMASYDEENYESAKSDMLARYAFLEETIQDPNGDYVIPVTSFEYEGYFFQIVPNPECKACKSFMMVGYNDTKQAIAYLYFYNYDQDYILYADASETEKQECMPKWIERYFVWYS